MFSQKEDILEENSNLRLLTNQKYSIAMQLGISTDKVGLAKI